MSGFWQDGKWHEVVVGGYRDSTQVTEKEVAAATRRVESGETTASYELRTLLGKYPSLKLDRNNHPLTALAGLYAEELLNN